MEKSLLQKQLDKFLSDTDHLNFLNDLADWLGNNANQFDGITTEEDIHDAVKCLRTATGSEDEDEE